MTPGVREYRRVEEAEDDEDEEEDALLAGEGEEEDEVAGEIRALRTQLEDQEDNVTESKETLRQMGDHFQSRICELEDEMILVREERMDKEAQLDFIVNPPVYEAPNPGPECLGWIQGDRFSLVATVVIVSNIATMVLELVDKANEKKFFWFDQSFMVFYVMELSIKATLLHSGMFFGKISIVWWNWLDSIIVFTGILDMWVQPVLVDAGLMQEGGSALKMMSFLRMLRLLRILKIIGLFLKADMSWTQDTPFQLFIMGVIGFNSILMSFESDIPDFFLWFYIEQVLLVIFSFEVACRLKFFGLSFFSPSSPNIGWNLLDFTIVAGGIVDMWMMPTVALIKQLMGMHQSHGGNMGQIMTMLRMARLLRILRLVRLVKNIPPLFNLVVGIVQAFQGMVWVMVLTMLVFYVFSLLGVKLIGHGLVFTLMGVAGPPKVLMVFPSVMDSIFVLFKAMNGDWEALMPLLDALPISKVVLVMYTILSSWAILSILTAVVSENMLAAAEATNEEKEAEHSKRTEERSRVKLNELFERVDINQNNTLSKSEFNMLIEDSSSKLEFEDAADLRAEDLQHIFEFLSMDPGNTSDGFAGEPQISRDTFVEGLREEHNEVKEKSFMKLEKRVYKIVALIDAMELHDKEEEKLHGMYEQEETQEEADLSATSALRHRFSETKASTCNF